MNLKTTLALCLVVGLSAFASPVAAQYVANSLSELRTYASLDNATVTLTAGEYWLEGDGSNPTSLDFSGHDIDLNWSSIFPILREYSHNGEK